MRTGKLFRLTRPTVAIRLVNVTRTIVNLPANAVVKTLSGPDANGKVPDKGIVYATWEDRTIAIFVVDLEIRALRSGKATIRERLNLSRFKSTAKLSS